ncbi:MAG: hypothetical protein EZS28_028013 [Streblomastix strix]|uniref:Uncharacterized protein n=1 Tax=Streblomastix strix TaxID=222440 RepID=A0A5J4V303_9EUKA|nr:MAG: hypothetical protein EZS28_028013 [Streblomastix strix]
MSMTDARTLKLVDKKDQKDTFENQTSSQGENIQSYNENNLRQQSASSQITSPIHSQTHSLSPDQKSLLPVSQTNRSTSPTKRNQYSSYSNSDALKQYTLKPREFNHLVEFTGNLTLGSQIVQGLKQKKLDNKKDNNDDDQNVLVVDEEEDEQFTEMQDRALEKQHKKTSGFASSKATLAFDQIGQNISAVQNGKINSKQSNRASESFTMKVFEDWDHEQQKKKMKQMKQKKN